ncbi:MAG: hypothetical protein AAF623_04415 [Planctomycetota bacterium]
MMENRAMHRQLAAYFMVAGFCQNQDLESKVSDFVRDSGYGKIDSTDLKKGLQNPILASQSDHDLIRILFLFRYENVAHLDRNSD